MKDLITTIAAVAIMMVFVLQFTANQVLSCRILAADREVRNYVNSINTEDEASDEIKANLIKKLSECLNCREDEVILSEYENIYEVKAPIRNIVACGSFLGISEAENMAEYTFYGEAQ